MAALTKSHPGALANFWARADEEEQQRPKQQDCGQVAGTQTGSAAGNKTGSVAVKKVMVQ